MRPKKGETWLIRQRANSPALPAVITRGLYVSKVDGRKKVKAYLLHEPHKRGMVLFEQLVERIPMPDDDN